tara:strand:- start:179 stop:1870 length:1692 start_codon:yes stop_codon:yes gene_type:complete
MAKRIQVQGPNVRGQQIRVNAPIVDTYFKPEQETNKYAELSKFLNEVVPEVNELMLKKDNERIEREVEMLGEIAISNLDNKTYKEVVKELGLRDSQASFVQFNQRIGQEEGKEAARQAQAWWGENQQRFYESQDKTTFESEREALQQKLFPAGDRGLGYASSYNTKLQGVMSTIDQNFYASFSAKNKEFKMDGAVDAQSSLINSGDVVQLNANKNALVEMGIWTGTEITEITNKSFTQSFALAETIAEVDNRFAMYQNLESGSGKMYDIPSNKLLAITERDRAYARLASNERTARSLQNAAEDSAVEAIQNAAAELTSNGEDATPEAIEAIVGNELFDTLGEYRSNVAINQGRNSSDSMLVSKETSISAYDSLLEKFNNEPTRDDKEELLRSLSPKFKTTQGKAFATKVMQDSLKGEDDQLMKKTKSRIQSMYGFDKSAAPNTVTDTLLGARAAQLFARMKAYYVTDLINNDEIEMKVYEDMINVEIDRLMKTPEFSQSGTRDDFLYPNGKPAVVPVAGAPAVVPAVVPAAAPAQVLGNGNPNGNIVSSNGTPVQINVTKKNP